MIHYVTGNATRPDDYRPKGEALILAHVCNDAGGWGAGFTGALSHRWSFPEQDYRDAYRKGEVELGHCGVSAVSPSRGIYVVNMYAQHGYSRPGEPAIRYGALFLCLRKLDAIVKSTRLAHQADVSVHMPRVGTGLGGGRWDVVESLVKEAFADDVPIFVYDLPPKR